MGASVAASAAGQAMQQPSGLAGTLVPGMFSSAQQAMQQPLGLAGSMFGFRRAIQQAQQAQQPQIGTAEQIAASGINNQDPNNLSSTGFGGVVTQNNNMMNPGEAQLATGNAPQNTLTAGMAVGDAPIATAGNFNPQTEFAAARMFGNGTQFIKPKKLINL